MLWDLITYACCRYLGPISISNNTSYHEILQGLKGVRLGVRMFISLWNLSCTSAAVLLRCLSKDRSCSFETSRDLRIRRIIDIETGPCSCHQSPRIWLTTQRLSQCKAPTNTIHIMIINTTLLKYIFTEYFILLHLEVNLNITYRFAWCSTIKSNTFFPTQNVSNLILSGQNHLI